MHLDTSAELMARIVASIVPVRDAIPLRQVLAEDFPRDCMHLPIAGGWGYSQDDAIRFVKSEFRGPLDFVGLEYHIAQKLLYEQLIIFRRSGEKFSGIDHKLVKQRLVFADERQFDCLTFEVHCWTEQHWNALSQEWTDSAFGTAPEFDQAEHFRRREAARVSYVREFWFDITELWVS